MPRFHIDNHQKSAPPGLEYLFIDAASLAGYVQKLSTDYFGQAEFRFSLRNAPARFTKIFYYDAVPRIEQGEHREDYEKRISSKIEELEEIGRTNGVHVFEGEAIKRKRRGLEQKMVDVKLAVDLLTCSYRRLATKVTVLTGDLDLLPAFEAIQNDGMYVTLWYPPDGTSDELKRAADVRVPLWLDDIKLLLKPISAELFKLPVVRNSANLRELGLPIRKWRDPNLGPSRLYKHGTTWTVAVPNSELSGHRRIFSSENFRLLQKYLGEHGISCPDIE